MLLAVGQMNNLTLELEQGFNESNVEVITEEIHFFFFLLAVLRLNILAVINLYRHQISSHISAVLIVVAS